MRKLQIGSEGRVYITIGLVPTVTIKSVALNKRMKSCHDGYAGTKTGHGVKEYDQMGYCEKVCVSSFC